MLPARRVARAIAATRGDAPGTRPPISALARGFASSDASGPEVVDVCVVGGGVVGTAMACLLRASPRTKHLSVTLVDRAAPPPPSLLDAPPAVADARVSALTPASVALLRSVGAWDRVAAARARPFTAMQVWDARAPGHVRYDASELGADALGYVVENRIVHAALAEAANRLGVVAAAPSGVEGVRGGPTLPGPFSVVTLRRVGDAKDTTSDTATTDIHARVVVGADGANSRVRALAGLRAPGWSYGQKAAVGTVTLSRASDVAWQRFLPDGPIAVLPATDDPCVANVVWTNTPQEADRLVSLSDEDFANEVDEAVRGVGKYDFSRPSKAGDAETFPSRLSGKDALVDVERLVVSSFLEPLTKRGMSMSEQAHRNGGLGAGVGLVGGAPFETPPRVTGAGGTRGAFPLATRMAGRHVSSRLALIGDAAHQVHPLGGQGVNLGLRDAQLLQGVFEETCAVGGDVGSSSCLLAYEKKARAANAPMMAALDALQKLFAVDSAGVAWARGFGLAGVNAIGPLRREIAKYAMGGA
jgi:ubiquinone biosynthesis monooxygenase Coq6